MRVLTAMTVAMVVLFTGCKDTSTPTEAGHSGEQKDYTATSQPNKPQEPLSVSSKDKEITDVMHQQIQAMNDEDHAAYLATIDEESPAYYETAAQMRQLFDMYDLKAEILSVEVVEKDNQTAKIRAVQTTRKLSGPEFQDNHLTALHSLVFKRGRWLFQSSKIEEIKMLN